MELLITYLCPESGYLKDSPLKIGQQTTPNFSSFWYFHLRFLFKKPEIFGRFFDIIGQMIPLTTKVVDHISYFYHF